MDPSTKKVLLFGRSEDGLCTLPLRLSSSFHPCTYFSSKASSNYWHLRMGHPHQRILHQVLKKHPVFSLVLNDLCSAWKIPQPSPPSSPCAVPFQYAITAPLSRRIRHIFHPSPTNAIVPSAPPVTAATVGFKTRAAKTTIQNHTCM
ncbi:hypothetical protein HAX54_026694 [Datura stramonium]|uniref:GAG-pre-integrase domain-containing protein n=1 Tax=Datura stramonium TaxID=4076 RepID=A0ABS8V1Q6_DATST|nr:hypothetical protein [Datura stramonium]